MNPRFSVILPVYNGQDFIEESLRCVFQQEYAPYEVLVVNDGSTDGTQKILERYADKIIIKNIPNSGVAAARNEGLRRATGDYVAFLDADDLWFRNKLQVNADTIRRFPDVDVFCSDFIVRYAVFGHRMKRHFSVIKRSMRMNFNEPLRQDALKLLIRQFVLGTPSAVTIKRSAAESVGFFDTQYNNAEDLDYFLRVAIRSNFLFINVPLLYKHTHEEGLSYKKIPLYQAHRHALMNFMQKHREVLAGRGLDRDYKKKLADLDYMLGNLHFEKGKVKEGYKLYGSALSQSHDPENLLCFLWTVSKKTVRLLTFGLLSRKWLGRFFSKKNVTVK